MMYFEPRLFESLNYLEPLRPDRVDQYIGVMRLNQKRGMTNPGDTDFALADFREMRPDMIPCPLGK